MKLEIIEENIKIVPEEESSYLALDKDDQLWLVAEWGGVFFDSSGEASVYTQDDIMDAVEEFGPFRRFNGKIMLSNRNFYIKGS